MPIDRDSELQSLRSRLQEAEQTLDAIRGGEVDSLVVSGPDGDQIFTLHGAEQPYRVFVEQMLEGAVTLTPDGTILYCNRRFAQMLNFPLERVIGTSFRDFLSELDEPRVIEILSSPNPAKARFSLVGADEIRVPAQLAFSRLPSDELEAICVVVTDLTEQEEKIELSNALHRLRGAQDLLKRQNTELAEARQEAESANEAKDNFLAALSHELRTPLTPIIMIARALEADRSIPSHVREDLTLLRRNVDLEARLIDDLLDLTRIVRGKIELQIEVVDVHAILETALNICASELAEKQLQVTSQLNARHFRVLADRTRVQQVFWNLVRNAVKFTPAGGRIHIRTDNPEPGSIRVSISDSGIGIDPKAIDRIFTPFEQADRLITRQFGGLGLGLAISRRLVELHKGEITARSPGRDRGATFSVMLPAVTGNVQPTALSPDPSTAGAPSQAAPQLKRLNILLVEDHDDTRRSMARLLARRHDVRDVRDVASALAAAETEPFDLVISDLGLPDGSGLDLMRALRDSKSMKGICLSGFGMEEDISRSTEAGFLHHLTKPIDFVRLESVIASLSE